MVAINEITNPKALILSSINESVSGAVVKSIPKKTVRDTANQKMFAEMLISFLLIKVIIN